MTNTGLRRLVCVRSSFDMGVESGLAAGLQPRIGSDLPTEKGANSG